MKEHIEKTIETSKTLNLSEEAYRVLPFLLFDLSKETEVPLEFTWSAQNAYEFICGPTFPLDRLKTIFEEANISLEENSERRWKNMGEREDITQGERYFSFFCPAERSEEARLLLGEVQKVTLFDYSLAVTRVLLTGQEDVTSTAGVEISGQCFDEGCDEAFDVLVANRIAGYSRETQVFVFDPSSRRGI
jgi:hypothetical protein